MNQIKLDLKDRRILDELDKEANIFISKLAKKVGISRQVAEYRLQKLLEQKTIYAFYPLIDVGRLGYNSFRIHLRIKSIDKEAYTKFAQELFTNYPTFWVGFISGSFDIITDIFAKTPNEFENIFSDILRKHKEVIQSYNILTILELDFFNYGYFFQQNKNRETIIMHKNISSLKLDEIDKKILAKIKYNSRASYESLGKSVGLTRNAVKQRMQKLEKNKIIAGYKVIVNFNHLDKQSFKIFVRYNNSKIEQEKELLEEIRQTPGILNILKFLGEWNLDIEIHRKDTRDLQQFIIRLRNKYDIIEDYEIVQIIDDYGIDFYPSKLN